jgi:hypothetical protein
MLGSVVRVVRSGLSPPPFRPDLWINRVGAPRTGLRPFALPRPDWLSPRCGLNVVAAYTARTSPKGNSRKFGKNNALKVTEFIENSSLPVFIRQHTNQRGKEVSRYAKLEHKHFVGGYEALVYSVMPGATERKEHEHSFPYKGG